MMTSIGRPSYRHRPTGIETDRTSCSGTCVHSRDLPLVVVCRRSLYPRAARPRWTTQRCGLRTLLSPRLASKPRTRHASLWHERAVDASAQADPSVCGLGLYTVIWTSGVVAFRAAGQDELSRRPYRLVGLQPARVCDQLLPDLEDLSAPSRAQPDRGPGRARFSRLFRAHRLGTKFRARVVGLRPCVSCCLP